MMDILRDSIWQFIGALFGFLALIISASIFFAQRKRKTLGYEISGYPLLVGRKDIKERLQIFFEGEPVQDVYFFLVTIRNTGNVSIEPDDYKYPIHFGFGPETQILTAEIDRTEPDNPQASVSIEATNVVLPKILLNAEDLITTRILISQRSDVKVGGRIVGVKEIENLREQQRSISVLLGAVGVFTLIAIGLASFVWGTILVATSLLSVGESMVGIFFIIFGFLILPIAGGLGNYVRENEKKMGLRHKFVVVHNKLR